MELNNDKYSTVKIKQEESLPAVCISCGNPSETFLFKLEIKPLALQLLFGIWYSLFSRTKVRVKLPICFVCKKNHYLIQPRNVDYTSFQMEFVVHTKFKEELEKLRKSRYIRY